MERSTPQARRERLTQLANEIGPVALARDRVLAVPAALEQILPDTGIVRGSIVGTRGATGLSVALAIVSKASAGGCWLACVGVPTLGLQAASEVGVALERLVMVASSGRSANVMSALIDGFDLIVLRDGSGFPAGVSRRLQARLQARGAVLVIVGDPGPFVCDVTITTSRAEWHGLGDGSGRLTKRRMTLSAVGRRSPRARHVDVWFPGTSGGIEAISTAGVDLRETG